MYMGGEYCDKINLVVARVDENTKKLHKKLSNKLEKKFKKSVDRNSNR